MQILSALQNESRAESQVKLRRRANQVEFIAKTESDRSEAERSEENDRLLSICHVAGFSISLFSVSVLDSVLA